MSDENKNSISANEFFAQNNKTNDFINTNKEVNLSDDKLRLNIKLYGFDGIIGRHDYFLNLIIIYSISLFFVIPYQFWLFSNASTYSNLLSLHKMFIQAPVLLKCWFLAGTVGTFVLSASNICRRLNDINGKINSCINGIVVFLFFLFSLSMVLPFVFCCFNIVIGTILKLILLLKRGKITGRYPYDFTKEFNWGAFIGTWIWGLFNKSYKTLWMLLLWFTPWALNYQLYCGLKGNEWAFKNKKCNDIKEFNKSQKKQGIIFTLLFSTIFFIFFITRFVTTLLPVFTVLNDVKTNPQTAEQSMTKFEDSLIKFSSNYFDSHLITEDENKYYVKSSDWKYCSFSDKKNMIDSAATVASIERKRQSEKQNEINCKCFSKAKELPRTKIYSSETKHLLGEYVMDEKILDSGSAEEILKAGLKAYRFYND